MIGALDVTYHIPMGEQSQAVERGGGSALVASAFGGTGSAGGVNAGAGVILQLAKTTAFRVDFTYRRFFGQGGSVGLSSLTFGIGIGY